jgi:pimeloyl-ACP methyl ester carboxylesterase
MPVPSRLQGHALMHILYLHGFASSAQSSKAAFFRTRLAQHHVPVLTPDFNAPDFSTLTVTRMLDQVGAVLDGIANDEPVALVGSSLGGFVAVHTALRYPRRIDRMVLLAPALDFGGNRMRSLGEKGIDEWRRTNTLEVFHHSFGRMMPVHFELYTDAARYDAFNAELTLPTLVFQGEHDDAVDPATVKVWCAARPNVRLRLLDDGHQLLDSLEQIWTETAAFFGLPAESTPAPSRSPGAAPQA